jgi:transglutaminase-like putative cysteine protease
MIKKIFVITLFLLTFIKPAFADENFNLYVNSTIKINKTSPTATVIQDIKIENLKEYTFSPSYSLTLTFPDVQNIKVYDSDGQIPFTVNTQDGKTKITANFTKRITGIGNINRFSIEFSTDSLAKKVGNIWEVTIPGIAHPEQFQEYTTKLVPPSDFGPPAIIKPAKMLSQNTLIFNKFDIKNSGIFLVFGNNQFYKFRLKYHLANQNLFPVRQEIALPPNTSYQETIIESIKPKPENVKTDPDGNWLASYTLEPREEKEIEVEGFASVLAQGRLEELTEEDVKTYTKPQKFWEVDNSEIKKLAQDLKTPKNIYDYVVSQLKYNYSKVNDNKRLGASKVLLNPDNAICLEFTDLFIALARAAGIPAREIEGFAYTPDSKLKPLSLVKDVLHSWPEYYDFEEKQWVQVDPTWGNTTGGMDYFSSFDFDHLAFVIHGRDSQYPLPAGEYKIERSTKDVEVDFASPQDFVKRSGIVAKAIFQNFYLSGVPIQGKIVLENTGNANIENQEVQIYSDLAPGFQAKSSKNIPPFGYKEILVNFDKTPLFLTNKKYRIKIVLGGTSSNIVEKEITVGIVPLKFLPILGGGIIALTALVVILTFKIRHLLIQKQG